MRTLHIGALWCIGVALGVIALTLLTTCYHTYYTVSPMLESYHHGHLGKSITELRETVHHAHNIAASVHPKHVLQLWNVSNAILQRVPWENLNSAVAHLQNITERPETKELIQSVDQVVRDIRDLPIDHVLQFMDRLVKR